MPALGRRASLTTSTASSSVRTPDQVTNSRSTVRPKGLREVAQLAEELEDVWPVVAPGAAQHMAAAEFGRGFERK